jgi:hypothetical protein
MLMIATAVPVMGTTTEIIKKETNSNLLKNEDFTKKNVYPLHDPEVEWERLYGGGVNMDLFRNVKQTTDGGYIAVGVWNGTNTPPLSGSHWLVKVDADGDEEWSVTALHNTSVYPRCYIVEQTSDGGYITAGCHEDTTGFGYNRCIWKVDEDGNTEWLEIYDDPLYGYHMCIQQTLDGGYIVSGEIDVTPGDWDVLLMKTDSTGTVEWQKIHKYSEYGDNAYAVRQTPSDGGYILCGRMGTGPGWTNADLLVIKTDSNGDILWDNTFGGENFDWSQSNDILLSSDGGYYFLGQTSSFGAGLEDIWLIKTDSNGNMEWNKTYGGKGVDMSGGMDFTDDGGIIITGTLDRNNLMPPMAEGLAIKTDENGNVEWANTFGGEYYDELQSVCSTSDGCYIAAGNFVDATLSSEGWLVKIKPFENNPPDKPKGKGETKIDPGKTYTFKVKTNDVDGDQIYYQWDWGTGDDESKSEWLGPYESGEECETDNYWDEGGKYEIKVRAKDEHGAESEWVNPKVKSNSYYKIFDLNFNLVNWLIVRLSRYFPGIINRI